MAPGGRTAFSPIDDAHLVEYLAEYNQGRKGNKLYHQLVDNPELFPWARRHSWQAWRHRYMRDTADFDRRIDLQQKRNLSTLFRNTENDASTSRNLPQDQEHLDRSAARRPRLQKRKETPTREINVQEKRRRIDVLEQTVPTNGREQEDFEAQDMARRVRLAEASSRPPPETTTKHVLSDKSCKPSPQPVQQRTLSSESSSGSNRMKDIPFHHHRSSSDHLRKEVDPDHEQGGDIAMGRMLLDPYNNTSTLNSTDLPPAAEPVRKTSEPNLPPTSAESFTKVQRSFSSLSMSWLSIIDQSRLVDMMVETLFDRYKFPSEYVLRVWKQAGDLEETEAILKQLRDLENGLLRESSSRRSSHTSSNSSGNGRKDGDLITAGGDSSIVRNPSRLRESISGDFLKPEEQAPATETRSTFSSPRTLDAHRNLALPNNSSSKINVTTPATYQSRIPEPTSPSPGSPKSSTTNGYLDNQSEAHTSKPSDVEATLPPKLQEIYSAISSPDRKMVLQKFWKAYGTDFIQVESLPIGSIEIQS
ncbi:hypothetical protein F5876DRAFT_79093 [Lentinula aff. lateritia]|uniref:Uncharacterized protein n=1 Tax=Lentinula aff. lateritia TaxID=2804960 RepID=A0ACC1TUR0_9AGAR|nr:hypothetical protein F5876DRAFT_79093 [Lentinula aff. lateritia]